jgi:hypothetical protein
LFSKYAPLLRCNLTNTQFFQLNLKIEIKYIVWININIVFVLKIKINYPELYIDFKKWILN